MAGISSRLQTELQGKTTYSPIPVAAFTRINGNLTLAPQAPRYTNGAPDLGYYYDALDYSVASLILAGGSLTVLPGTAIAVRNDYFPSGCFQGIGYLVAYNVEGIVLQQGSSLVSHGTPVKPNIFTAEKMVQEFPETDFAEYEYWASHVWFGAISLVTDYEFNNNNSAAPTLDIRFSKFYLPPGDYHIWSGFDEYDYVEMSLDSSMYLRLQDCQFHGGRINLGNPDFYIYQDPSLVYAPGAVTWVNNSFENVTINLDPTWYEYGFGVNCDMQVQADNNLFKGGLWFHLEPIPASAGHWTLNDNLFDKADISQDTNSGYAQPLDFSHNGYWPLTTKELGWDWDYWYFYPWWWETNSAQLQPTPTSDGSHEVTLSSPPPYQSGPFGEFYLPSNTPLYGAGSRSPADAGLYHYTTRLDQTKEGDESAGHMANIGLHYVAATNGVPLDSDSDGIPDYVEDANGNGFVDANETDALNPVTDGLTNDIYNAVYDDVDLSGNGLVGRIKKALGMNPLDSSNPLTLKQVVTDDPQIVSFEVPVSYASLTNLGTFTLNLNGVEVTFDDCSPATNGNTLINWNTAFDAPGWHFLQPQFNFYAAPDDPGVVNKAHGPLTSFYSANAMRFFEYSMFDDTVAYLDAKLPQAGATYTIKLYDASVTNATPVKTITGSTSSDMIQENWDLKYDDGVTVFTGDEVNAVFEVTPTSSAFSSATAANANNNAGGGNSGGTNSKTMHRLQTKEQGNGFDFIYMYTPSTGALLGEFGIYSGNPGSIYLAMQGVVDTLLMPVTASGGHDDHYDSAFDRYTSRDFPGQPGIPGYVTSRAQITNTPNGLLADMGNGTTKNFFSYAHGDAAVIKNFDGDVYMSAYDVATRLTNFYAAKGGLKAKNPYRFVFLNGCATASANTWRRAFGIFPSSAQTAAARQNIGPQAYVGWADDTEDWMGTSPTNSEMCLNIAKAYTKTLNRFYGLWMSGNSLAQCIDDACSANAPCPFPVPKNKSGTIHGVSPDNYTYRYTNIYTANIYVVGHSGLTRDGVISGQDGYYAAPPDKE